MQLLPNAPSQLGIERGSYSWIPYVIRMRCLSHMNGYNVASARQCLSFYYMKCVTDGNIQEIQMVVNVVISYPP